MGSKQSESRRTMQAVPLQVHGQHFRSRDAMVKRRGGRRDGDDEGAGGGEAASNQHQIRDEGRDDSPVGAK